MKINQDLLKQIILEETRAVLSERSILDPFGFKDEDPEADAARARDAAIENPNMRKVNALAIAWPEYEFNMPKTTKSDMYNKAREKGIIPDKLGFPLGHAGIVIIDEKGVGRYFDFGKYLYGAQSVGITGREPETKANLKQGGGLVRGPWKMKGKAIWDYDGSLKNEDEYLASVKAYKKFKNYSGQSQMKVALVRGINAQRAYAYANSKAGRMKPYNFLGPAAGGENCATFVAEVLSAGGGEGAGLSMRKMFLAKPDAIIDYAIDEKDEKIVSV
jgi:hypothetical protein